MVGARGPWSPQTRAASVLRPGICVLCRGFYTGATAAALGHGGGAGHLSAFAGTCCAGGRRPRGLALGADREPDRAGLRRGGGPSWLAQSGAFLPRPAPSLLPA